MPEIRFEGKRETLNVIDGYCSGTGKCRTEVINAILEQWATAKAYEATLVCRVAGINPMQSDTDRGLQGCQKSGSNE